MRKTLLILSIITPALAVLVTLLTGNWQPYSTPDYGFPLTWKSLAWIGCAPCPLGEQCCSPTNYNWLFFALDAAFYATLGYTILTACYSTSNRQGPSKYPDSPRISPDLDSGRGVTDCTLFTKEWSLMALYENVKIPGSAPRNRFSPGNLFRQKIDSSQNLWKSFFPRHKSAL